MIATALKPSLGPLHLAAIGMGTTIGVGWIVVTGGWIIHAGPAGAALAFLLGGLVMGLVALCYTDLAVRLPDASGEHGYVSAVFGAGWAFPVGWAVLLGYVAICCFEGLALAWLVGFLAPDMVGPVLYTSLGAPVRLLDLILVGGGAIFFTGINYLGARESASLQVTVTIAKVVLSLAFVAIGVAGGNIANLAPAFEPQTMPWQGVAAVLVVVPAWFCGFNALPQALPEAADRPRAGTIAALLGSVIAMTAIFYIAVIIATAAAAPRSILAASELPVVAAIDAVVGPWGGRMVLVTGVVALLSAWNAAMFGSSRLIYTLARAGALPHSLAFVHPVHGTPAAALVFVGVITMAGGLMGRAFIEPLLQIGSIGFALAFVAACLCSLRLNASASRRRAWIMIAGVVAALSLGGVLLLSLSALFLGAEKWPAEVSALLGWIGAGLGLRLVANWSNRTTQPRPISP